MLRILVDLFPGLRGKRKMRKLKQELREVKAALRKLEEQYMADFSELEAAVRLNTEITGSAVQLLEGLAERIRDSIDDPEELSKLVDELESNTEALAAAIAANTITDETPTTSPPEESPAEEEGSESSEDQVSEDEETSEDDVA